MQVLRKHKVLMFSSLLALAGVAVLTALFIIKPWAANSASEAPVIFIRDNLLMMLQKDEKHPIELSVPLPEDELRVVSKQSWGWKSIGNHLFKMNEQRDKIFFVREVTEYGKAVLYYRDSSEIPSDGKPGVELASAISRVKEGFFEISIDGEFVFYFKEYDDQRGGALYVHNLHKETLIDEKVIDYNYIDKPGLLYYTVLDEQNRKIIKMAKRSNFDKKTEIDTDVDYIWRINRETGEVHYAKTTSTGIKDLYSVLPDQSPTHLVSNFEGLVLDIHEGSFFYRANDPTNQPLSNVVIDDLVESDAAIKEPKEEDFTTVERRRLINYWTGDPYEADVEVFDESGFDKAEERYQEKVKRDNLRRELKARSFDFSGSLNYFNEGQSVVIKDSYESILWADAETGMILYKSTDYTAAPKVPLSEVSFPEQAIAEYKGKLSEAAEAYLFTPRTGTIKLDKDSGASLVQVTVSVDGQKLYGIEKGGTLVSFDLEEGLPVHRKVLEESDVYMINYMTEGKEKLLYFKNSNGGSALYVHTNGASHKISEGVEYYSNIYYPELDEIYYLTAYDSDERAGTLYRYQNGKSVKVSDNVHDFYYNESSGLYYIINYDTSQGTGDLIRAGDGKPEQVADRVRVMLEEPVYVLF